MSEPHFGTVLVADDDEDLCDLLVLELKTAGYRAITAHDGRAALESARKNRPDLVLTDAVMPGLHGWHLVVELRSEPELAKTPVILMSGLSGSHDRLRGLRVGADDYITKPFAPAELIIRIERALKFARLSEE